MGAGSIPAMGIKKMEIKLRKVPSKELFWVVRNGRKVSSKPSSRAHATEIMEKLRRKARMSGGVSPFGASAIAAATTAVVGYGIGRETDFSPTQAATDASTAYSNAYTKYVAPRLARAYAGAESYYQRASTGLSSNLAALRARLAVTRDPVKKLALEELATRLEARIVALEEKLAALQAAEIDTIAGGYSQAAATLGHAALGTAGAVAAGAAAFAVGRALRKNDKADCSGSTDRVLSIRRGSSIEE